MLQKVRKQVQKQLVMRNHPALKSKGNKIANTWHILISTFGFEKRPSNYRD